MTRPRASWDHGSKHCWRCGAAFTCGASSACGAGDDGPCWCEQLPPLIPLEGADCLCPVCLAEATGAHDRRETNPTSAP